MSKTPAPTPDPNNAPKQAFEIEVFRSGTFTPMQGAPVTYSAEDLANIASAYDGEASPAPVVVGHPETDAPAFGWIESFRYDGDSDRLIARVNDLVPEFAEQLGRKLFRKVSMAFFRPDAPNNPKPDSWYPKHLGFLGAAAPAVSGLKPVALAGDESETLVIEFGEAGFRDSASLFRRCRDFFIDQFGLEKADEVLPSWEIDWLERRADDEPARGFSEPTPNPEPKAVSNPDKEAEFAERQSALEKRESEIAAREAETRHEGHEAFCEALVADGKMLPANKAANIALLDSLAADEDAKVSFAGDDGKAVSQSRYDTFRRQLKSAPKFVEFGQVDMGDEPDAGSDAAFASPDGQAVDPESLARHQRAVEYQRQHPDTVYLDAVAAVG